MAGSGISGRALGRIGPTEGTPVFLLTKAVDATASSFTIVASAPFKFRVLDARVYVTTAAAGGTIRIDNGSTAITDAMTAAVDKTVDRAGTINDAQRDISRFGSLKITTTNGAIGYVQVLCARV